MEHRATLIRNVEIPTTLPPMDTLTNLTGSILLKEVNLEEDHLRIDGDLLWRGYFEEGGSECLWEGAEYFTEFLAADELREEEPPLLQPTVIGLKGESLSESTFRLTFDVCWFEEETEVIEEIVIEEEPLKAPQRKETAAAHCQREKCQQAAAKKAKEEPAGREELIPAAEFAEKIEAIDETWRETIKGINEPLVANEKKGNDQIVEAQGENREEETEIKVCPYSKYCLRYYRTQDGDELERIAEKFSATVAKLKEYNHLDSAPLQSGRLLRIP